MGFLIIFSLILFVFGQNTVDVVRCQRDDVVAYTRIFPGTTQQSLYTVGGVIVHLSDQHVVTISTDHGRSWKSITGLDGPVRSFTYSKDQKNFMFFGFGSLNTIWVSIDGAVSISSRITSPGLLSDIRWHPKQSKLVMGIVRASCHLVPSLDCSWDLYYSPDAGATWALLRKYVWTAAWHEGANAAPQALISWERKLKSGNQYDRRTTEGAEYLLVKSDSYFREDPDVLMTNVLGFLGLAQHIFVAKAGDTAGSYALWSSTDMGENFRRTRFSEGFDEKSYTILDVSEGSSFIMVTHGPNWGNVYAGDDFDEDFVLSLRQVVRSAPGTTPAGTDFRDIKALEGIYIANKWTGISTTSPHLGYGLQTVISYDKGAQWETLKTSKGQLNLQGPAEEIGGFYTTEEAVGIMFASGSVGPTLAGAHDLYFSRDAGWNWTWTAEGSHVYDIGNKGAIVVAAKDEEWTNQFKFSLNEGASWVDCPIFPVGSNKQVDFEDIFTDSALTSKRFVAFGDLEEGGGLITVIDFSEVHERECTANDYEIWQPSDSFGNDCILGRQMSFKRRKQMAECFMPADFNVHGQFVKNCPCGLENFECDFCYVRSGKLCAFDSKNPDCDIHSPAAQQNRTCPPGQNITLTQGYRRVPGDSCDVNLPGSLNYLPLNRTCEKPWGVPNGAGIVAVVFVVIFVVGGAVLWWLAATNETVRSALTRVIPEKFLPDRRDNLPNAQYSALGGGELEAVSEDAQEINHASDDLSSSS